MKAICRLACVIAIAATLAAEAVEAQAANTIRKPADKVSDASARCLECHRDLQQGIVAQWQDSGHAKAGVGCYECHRANKGEADAFDHYDATIAVVVTPRDCASCHEREDTEFEGSHHAKAGNILASLDNYLAETVEGSRTPFDPHAPAAGGSGGDAKVNGLASVQSGCMQCHGAKTALKATDGGSVTVDDLQPGPDGKPTDAAAMARIARDGDGKPQFVAGTWPNTGIGRLNLDGSHGSCTACHSRHDFSPRRARQPENCGKCHLGPDHPQKEIYEESKHGIAYRDLRDEMNLDAKSWILGKDYTQAATCATCHMSATVSGLQVTHDPGERISWTNRPPISQPMDTDAAHKVITETDPQKRKEMTVDTAMQKRDRMKTVCSVCHSSEYVDSFYEQYDDLITLYNEKFAKPGSALMKALYAGKLITEKQFDEEIEWDWFYLWHHEGRRARHGASMMAPDYTHWHGMYEVAERFYVKLLPEAREISRRAAQSGKKQQAAKVDALIDEILARPEHAWFLAQRAQKPAAK